MREILGWEKEGGLASFIESAATAIERVNARDTLPSSGLSKSASGKIISDFFRNDEKAR